jgi:hypothetical protein
MLTSFFGKSNPINYVLLSALLFIGFLAAIFKGSIPFSSPPEILTALSLLLLLVFSLLLLDFVIRKNNLTGKNTYGILFFTLFIIQLPVIHESPQLIWAMLFLMLATRRFLSLNSDINIEKKILDASFYIAIAGLFFPWCWLFFGVLFLSIFSHTAVQLRYLIIPVIGVLVVFILKTTYHFLADDGFEWFFTPWFEMSFSFGAYNSLGILITALLVALFILWMGNMRLIRIPTLPKKERSSAWLILISLVVTMFIAVLGNVKTGAELLLPVFPLAIISANFLEVNEGSGRAQPFDFWFKELLMWFLLLISVVLLIV